MVQNSWMANNKTKAHFPAFVHALLYSITFIWIAPSWTAWGIIFVTHFLIDRYRLATYYIAWYNDTEDRKANFGFSPETPVWMACWLSIIIDNTFHLCINWLCITYL